MQRSAAFALVLSLAPPFALAASLDVPRILPIQGRLLDGEDRPVNGPHTLTVTIYRYQSAPTPGNDPYVWRDTVDINCLGGVFSAVLGERVDNAIDLAELSGDRFLGFKVDGDAEAFPRLRLGSTAFALAAGTARKADDAERLGGELPAAFHDAALLTGVAPPAVLGAGSTGLTTLGTVTAGTWAATPIDDARIASAGAWHDKLDTVEHGGSLAGSGRTDDPLRLAFGTTAGTAAEGNDARFGQFAQFTPTSQLDAAVGGYGYLKAADVTSDLIASRGFAPGPHPSQASQLSVAAISGLDTTNVQTALAGLKTMVDATPNAALGVRALASAPACSGDAARGQLYFDFTLKSLLVCNGTAWQPVAGLPGTGLAGMPMSPAEYIEFSQVASTTDLTTWDQTGRYKTGLTNTMTWDATLKAMKSAGSSSSAIDTAWKPTGGQKTACMWKRFWDATNMAGDFGLEGYQQTNYFYYGSYQAIWYFYSGANGGNATGQGATPNGPTLDKWTFYCLASGGSGSNTQFYSAIPGDTQPVLRHNQASNLADSTHASESVGMRYGVLSSNQHPSKAYYGSFIHFDAQLSAAQVKQVYDATKVYYPDHGGTR